MHPLHFSQSWKTWQSGKVQIKLGSSVFNFLRVFHIVALHHNKCKIEEILDIYVHGLSARWRPFLAFLMKLLLKNKNHLLLKFLAGGSCNGKREGYLLFLRILSILVS